MNGEPATAALPEDVALALGLLFRALAPMRSRDRMRAVAEGIDAMDREEAAYWLGMAMHRRNPRRILKALRVMLTDPTPSPFAMRVGKTSRRHRPAHVRRRI